MPDTQSSQPGILRRLLRYSGWVACVALLVMMSITVVDVFMRFLFARPVVGANEVVELSMVCLSALAIAWCAVNAGHIQVDLFIGKFSSRVQAGFDAANYVLAIIVGAVIGWYSLEEAVFARQLESVTSVLEIAQWPFYVILGIGYLVLMVAGFNLLRQAFKAVRKG